MTIIEFSAFHNWCDRRCEACPLQVECPVPGAGGTLEEKLAQACHMLERICAEQGIAVDDLPSPPQPSMDAALLRRAAVDHATASFDLGVTDNAVLLAGKVARVASYHDEYDEWVWGADAVPNLLLIENLLDAAEAEIERRSKYARREAVDRAVSSGRLLRGLLRPLLDSVPAVARRVLAAMVAAGHAPSPFVSA